MTVSVFFGVMQSFKSTRNISRETNKADRIIVSGLDYGDINFSISKKDYGRIEKKHLH